MKLPNCHFCGKTVARKARAVFQFHKRKFAWHTEPCSTLDPLFDTACKAFAGKMKEKTAIAILDARTVPEPNGTEEAFPVTIQPDGSASI